MSKHKFRMIGLTGPAGSGKDTVAALLQVHCGYTAMAFADPLRGEVAAAFGIDPALLIERATKEHPISALALHRCLDANFEAAVIAANFRSGAATVVDTTAPRSPRQIMQWWGTEYRRARNTHYWTRALSQRVADMHRWGHAHRFVLTDLRFANEADLIREFGGTIWQIMRPGLADTEGGHPSAVTGSEFKPDQVIHNNHDLRHLQQLVLGAVAAQDWGVKSVRVEVTE